MLGRYRSQRELAAALISVGSYNTDLSSAFQLPRHNILWSQAPAGTTGGQYPLGLKNRLFSFLSAAIYNRRFRTSASK
jgi:hypothetical protein